MTVGTATEDSILAPAEDTSMALVLPGSWAKIPLDSEAASNQEIARIIKARLPRRDELAQMRRETRQMMRALAAEARTVDAVLLALSLEILPGVPFSSAIVAAYLPAPPADETSLGERLLETIPGGEIIEFEHGIGVREFERATTDEDGQARTTIDLRYVIPSPLPEQWLQVMVDVPTEVDTDLIVELFDTIMNSLRWFRAREATDQPT